VISPVAGSPGALACLCRGKSDWSPRFGRGNVWHFALGGCGKANSVIASRDQRRSACNRVSGSLLGIHISSALDCIRSISASPVLARILVRLRFVKRPRDDWQFRTDSNTLNRWCLVARACHIRRRLPPTADAGMLFSRGGGLSTAGHCGSAPLGRHSTSSKHRHVESSGARGATETAGPIDKQPDRVNPEVHRLGAYQRRQ
jgi:hypothetical protein